MPQNFLHANNITYVLHEHPAVFTCAEADEHCGDIPGLACKNLLLRNQKKSRYFLILLPADKRTDLKKLTGLLGESKISFASPDDLQVKLGLTPGEVSPFGLLNDTDQAVELYVDAEVHGADIVSFHPNRNTATLELTQEMFHKFLGAIPHETRIIEL